jgi:O-antigen ligase
MPFVLPSMLGGYLIMMLPLSLGYLFKENKRYFPHPNLKNISLILLTLLIAFVLLLTKSVGAFLSIFLSFLIFIVLSRHFNKKSLLLLLILFLTFTAIFILRSYKAEYFTTPTFSLQKRLIYWQNALSVILRHPFRGIGLGNFPFIQSQFAHNSYLQIWAEIGFLGIIGFLGFIYKSLKTIQLKKLIADKLYAGLLIAILSFLIHNLVDFSFFIPEVSIFWWIFIALFLSSTSIPEGT